MIEHERVEDAPFIGGLVCAVSCNIGCKGCFNEPLKKSNTLIASPKAVLDEVEGNPFNEGLILAGLEWSNQPEELIALVEEAVLREMPVIIYTGYAFEVFEMKVPGIKNIKGDILIKHGPYDQRFESDDHYIYGVKLATSNQRIDTLESLLNNQRLLAI